MSGERRDLRDSLPGNCYKGVFACCLGVAKITSGGIKKKKLVLGLGAQVLKGEKSCTGVLGLAVLVVAPPEVVGCKPNMEFH